MVTKIQDNYDELFDVLGTPVGGLFITAIEPRLWGKELVFRFLYNPHTDNKPFEIIFKDCSAVQWQDVGADIDDRDIVADVIGTRIGEAGHRKPAIINSTLFEIQITYGTLVLQKDW